MNIYTKIGLALAGGVVVATFTLNPSDTVIAKGEIVSFFATKQITVSNLATATPESLIVWVKAFAKHKVPDALTLIQNLKDKGIDTDSIN